MSGVFDQRTTSASLALAGVTAATILAAIVLIMPNGGLAMPVVVPFLPMFAATVIIVEGLTAYFLAIQFSATKVAYLGALAGAYGYIMVMAALQILVFPGVFSKTGLFGAGPQTAIWMWVFWHGGFPTLVGLALLLRSGAAIRIFGRHLPQIGLALMIAGPLAAALLAYLAIAHPGTLPALIQGGSYATLRESLAAKLVLTAIVLALAICVRISALRDLLSLWVAVALLASLGDAFLVLHAGARYSLGWYGGRMLSVVSSSVVLCALISELSKLYFRLVTANAVLADRATHDGLTGAFNRLYFGEQLPREFRVARREGTALAVVMIDVDHFKRYNDQCGHQMGDQCLIAIVKAIQTAVCRPGDFVARYGGEEFVIVMPRTDLHGARHQANLAREAVRALKLNHPGSPLGIVTISLGAAAFSPRVDEFDETELIARADAALYEAKHGGRDRVSLAGLTPLAAALTA